MASRARRFLAARRASLLARVVLTGLVLLWQAGCRPVLATAIGVDEIEPATLHRWQSEGRRLMVLDVRPGAATATLHIAGARAVRLDELPAWLARGPGTPGAPVVTVCERGYESLEAAAILQTDGRLPAHSLAGGMTDWRGAGLPLASGPAPPLAPGLAEPPRLAASRFVQGLVVATAFGVKPTYMLLSLLLVVWLRRAVDRDLRILRRGLAAFLLGEVLCAVNYLALAGRSTLLEIGHGIGMVVMGGLIPWGMFALLDRRVLRLTDPQASCAFNRLCRRCAKRDPVACGLHRSMLLAAPLMTMIALLPLSTPLELAWTTIDILGTPVLYHCPLGQQLVELRLFPLLAAAALLATTVALARGFAAVRSAEPVFFAGVGLLSYALLRYLLRQAFHAMPPWADSWEELTELAMVLLVGGLLVWFRHPLGLARAPDPAVPPRSESPA